MYFVFVGSQIKTELAVDLMKTGSIDVLLKPLNEKKLAQEIEKAFVLAQKKKAQVTQAILNLGHINQLTSKEITILVQILEGFTNKEIAEKMGNSSRTIEIHRASIFDKLDVKNAIEICTKLRT
jgi:FixJ family two-component response regulator